MEDATELVIDQISRLVGEGAMQADAVAPGQIR